MTPAEISELARQLLEGQLPIARFVELLANRPPRPLTADLGLAQLDLDRRNRCGFAEVVYGEGKSLEALRQILATLLQHEPEVLATRVEPEMATALSAEFPTARYNPLARTLRVTSSQVPARSSTSSRGFVAVITAGTTDLPVAEEARETLDWMGVRTDLIQDVGVAGPHRLPAQLHRFQHADVVVVVAGMEAALPSVVGGYVPCPVIGVPTSVGYGVNFHGLTALLGMLSSCASNVSVVNINAGFKGGYLAGLIAHRRWEAG